MKKSIIISLLIRLIIIPLFAQDIVIENLEDINSFTYDTVDNLYIENTEELTSIFGFDSLKVVKNDLIISMNLGINICGGFENLKIIGNDFYITDNFPLTSIDGFNSLDTIHGEFDISWNDLLFNINSFKELKYIGKGLNLIGWNLCEINGFSSLNYAGNIGIYHSALKDINFLSNLSSANDGIGISDNDSLININSLANINYTKYLDISNNKSLVNLHGLSGLTKVSYAYIYDNESLQDLTGLNSLDTVQGDILIHDNSNLISLEGVNSLEYIEQDLRIYENDNLANINALGNLSRIGGDLYINNNNNLSECSAIKNLLNTPTAIQGEIHIYNNMSNCNYDDLISAIKLNTIKNIRVYTNPYSSLLVIDLKNDGCDYNIQIYDIYGRLISSYYNIDSRIIIDCSEYQQGIYFYIITSPFREIISGKIIIE